VTLVSKTYWAGMPFWFRRPPQQTEVESLVLRAHDMRQLRALWWYRGAPKIGVVVIHPRVDFAHHYSIPRLVDAGFGVLAATARHAGNDTLNEYEEVVLDVAACVRYLREKRGVEKVILLGNCGGGSLLAYYQAQARLPAAERITKTPAGSPTYFEGATMLPGDAMIYVATHRGLGNWMLDSIDPSVVDERDPLAVDPELDMYNPKNGFRESPTWSQYDPAFLARYRAAQRARVERLDAYARERIASRQTGDARAKVHEEIMIVHRTMANPACVDRSIDPSERDYGALLSERPDLMNYSALGLGRMMTPRGWLSTWSGLSSNADLVANVARITEPTLVVAAGRDREIFPRDIAAIYGAVAATDKSVETIAAARHYFEPEPGQNEGHVEPAMDLIVPWIAERFA
jgi:dienelactone hydrolase